MGKKLLRINPKHSNTAFLLNKEVDIVLHSKAVYHGYITQLDEKKLLLKSQKLHVLSFNLADISEIILSKDATPIIH